MSTPPDDVPPAIADVHRAIADAHRREWAFVLAATARVAGDIDLAEECVQDAYVSALDAWTRGGVPLNPAAWLTTTARNRALDVHRRNHTLREKLPLLVEPDVAAPEPEDVDHIRDDRLRLVFTCCHPALGREAQVALTLRLVCGLTTAEIAQAFLVTEPTMAARVTRAKKKIAVARIPYRVPDAAELPDRLDAVLTVVHLLYTTGHTAPVGEQLVSADLVERSLELARMLLALMPDEREVRGLLALILLSDARATYAGRRGRATWCCSRSKTARKWDADQIARRRCARRRRVARRGSRPVRSPGGDCGRARRGQDLRRHRLAAGPRPVRRAAQAVALSSGRPEPVCRRVDGRRTAAALDELDELDATGRLAGYRYLPATRADLLRRLGRVDEAAREYRAAIELADNDAESAFLRGRLAANAIDPDLS